MLIYGNHFLNGLSASSLIVPQPSDPITVELIYIRCHPEVFPMGYQKKDIRALGPTYLSRLLLTVPHTDLTLPTNQTECSTQSRCSISHLFIKGASHAIPCQNLAIHWVSFLTFSPLSRQRESLFHAYSPTLSMVSDHHYLYVALFLLLDFTLF